MREVLFSSLLFLLFQTTAARAEDITRCGASTGWGYYSGEGFVQDQISQGGFLFTRTGEIFDIIISDVAGTRSATADGSQIFSMGDPSFGEFQLIAVSPAPIGTNIETFNVRVDAGGNGEVVWTSLRSGLLRGGKVMVATCSAP
jgi:hypothetical protein